MRFSLEQLQTFALVAQTGSFSAGARALGKTQSTVSTAIANLEVDLGVTLFERQGKTNLLTAAGQQLLAQARLVLDRGRELQAHANALADAVEPVLVLAIEVPYSTLMAPLEAFARQFPYVALNIRNPQHGDVSELLARGEADLGVAFSQPGYPGTLAFAQMGKLIMAHVARHDHPLAQMDSVDFATLRGHRRLVFTGHNRKLPSTEYLEVASCWQAESYLALLEMARSGLGWTTLPRQLIRRELESGELVELPLAAYPHTDWLVGVDLLWAQARPLGRAGRWLREQLAAHKVFEVDRHGRPTTF